MLLIEQSSDPAFSIIVIVISLLVLFLAWVFIDKHIWTKKEYVWLENGKDIDILRGDHYVMVMSMNPEYLVTKRYTNSMPEDETVKGTYRFYVKQEISYMGAVISQTLYPYNEHAILKYMDKEQYDKAWKYYRDRDETIDDTIRKYISQRDEVFANPPEDKNDPELWLSNNWIWFLQWEDEKVEFKY